MNRCESQLLLLPARNDFSFSFRNSYYWRPVLVSIAVLTNYHKQHKITVLQFWRPEVGNGSHWANIKVLARLHSFGRFWWWWWWGYLFACLFQLLEATQFLPVPSPRHPEGLHLYYSDLCFSCHYSFWLWISYFSCSLTRTLVITFTRPARPPDHLGHSSNFLSVIASLKSILPRRVTYQQNTGIWMWTSLGKDVHFSAHRKARRHTL